MGSSFYWLNHLGLMNFCGQFIEFYFCMVFYKSLYSYFSSSEFFPIIHLILFFFIKLFHKILYNSIFLLLCYFIMYKIMIILLCSFPCSISGVRYTDYSFVLRSFILGAPCLCRRRSNPLYMFIPSTNPSQVSYWLSRSPSGH